jgi:L-asparaginase II
MGKTSLPVVEVLRNGSVESIHRGSIAVVDRNGNRLFFWGDFDFPTIMRSCAKPFQALPLIESGAADHFGLTDEELAIATGSISGQDFQEAAVRSILKKIGLNESALQCGTHRPFHSPTAKRLEKEGKKAGPLRNSCAGKHAGILATCVFKNWPLETYTQLSHPIQRWIFEKVSEFTGVKANQIQISTDGCGLPTFQVPLKNLALSFARLTVRDESGISRLMACACQYPEMVAGEKGGLRHKPVRERFGDWNQDRRRKSEGSDADGCRSLESARGANQCGNQSPENLPLPPSHQLPQRGGGEGETDL